MTPEDKRKARGQQKKIHEDAMGRFHADQLKQTKAHCFVATAAFGNYKAPEVVYLSAFRDQFLNQSILGRGFIRAYYAVSPRFAAVIAKSHLMQFAVRKLFLQPVIFLLRQTRRAVKRRHGEP